MRDYEQHCVPYTDFVANIPKFAEDFICLQGRDDLRPTAIREFLKGRNYSLDDARDCRAAMAAFAAYMIDYHNCRVKPAGLFRKSLKLTQGSFSCDFFDLFDRVMMEGLEIPDDYKDKNLIEDE